MTAQQLAADLGLILRGPSDIVITGAAVPEDATSRDLVFAAAAKFYPAALASSAGCIIAPPDFPDAGNRPVLESPQPRAHFARALARLYPEAEAEPGVHPSSVVHPGAWLGAGVSVGPFATIAAGARLGDGVRIAERCSIGAEVVIGAGTRLYPGVTLYPRVSLGANCILHSGVVIGADGFGFEMAAGAWHKVPQVGTVRIGHSVEIGANSCIDRATLGVTVIGDGTKLDNMVHIAHNCRIGRHVVIAAQTGLAGGVTVGDYAVMGGQVGVGDKARIESKAIVGSGAGILTAKIVRAGEPVWGTPARPLRQYLAQLAVLSRLARRRGEK